jgi:hypothetical protein
VQWGFNPVAKHEFGGEIRPLYRASFHAADRWPTGRSLTAKTSDFREPAQERAFLRTREFWTLDILKPDKLSVALQNEHTPTNCPNRSSLELA